MAWPTTTRSRRGDLKSNTKSDSIPNITHALFSCKKPEVERGPTPLSLDVGRYITIGLGIELDIEYHSPSKKCTIRSRVGDTPGLRNGAAPASGLCRLPIFHLLVLLHSVRFVSSFLPFSIFPFPNVYPCTTSLDSSIVELTIV